jgi:glycerate-2-kinase
MASTAVATVIKMIESLPETVQDQVVEHLREYLADLQDEMKWDTQFKKTQKQLIAAARRAKKEIAKGHAKPLDLDQL